MLLIRYRGASWWPTVALQGYAQGNAAETIQYDASGDWGNYAPIPTSVVPSTGSPKRARVSTSMTWSGDSAAVTNSWPGELEANRITRAGTVRWIAAIAEFVNANPYPAPAQW